MLAIALLYHTSGHRRAKDLTERSSEFKLQFVWLDIIEKAL